MKISNLSKILFLSISLLFTHSASAKLLVISDIDDTIKEAYVLHKIMAVGNSFDHDDPFTGMAELYHDILSQNMGAHITYVSNAPKMPMRYSHAEFLEENNFPNGTLILNPGIKQIDKVERIAKQIEIHKPTAVLMIGDNGQKDIADYAVITSELAKAGIPSQTFIRIVYSSKKSGIVPVKGQKTFVTTGEIALELAKLRLINVPTALKAVSTSVHSRANLALISGLDVPFWSNCSEHKSNLQEFFSLDPLVAKLHNKIERRCR